MLSETEIEQRRHALEGLAHKHYSGALKEKLLSYIRVIEIKYSSDVVELCTRWFNEKFPHKEENKTKPKNKTEKEVKEEFQAEIKLRAEKENVKAVFCNLLEMLAKGVNFNKALEDKIILPIEQLLSLYIKDNLNARWFLSLNDQNVLNAIRGNKLPFIEILQWSDQWKFVTFFNDEATVIQSNRFKLLNALFHPNVIKALQDDKLQIDKIKILAQSNMKETADLLTALSAEGMKADCGIKFIIDGSLAFDDVTDLIKQHGRKEVINLIKALNSCSDSWLKSSLEPKALFQGALNYDGDLRDLAGKIWAGHLDEAKKIILDSNKSMPRLC